MLYKALFEWLVALDAYPSSGGLTPLELMPVSALPNLGLSGSATGFSSPAPARAMLEAVWPPLEGSA